MDLIGKNTLNDLLTKNEFSLYKELEYPFNIKILNEALKLKLKEDPNYEVFVPLIYFKCKQYIKDESSILIFKPARIYINNKGDILSGSYKGVKLLNRIVANEYQYTAITRNKRQINVMVHRAVACTFIPVPESFKGAHPNSLQVNHIDAIKLNCCFTNLEWCTPLGNMIHARSLGLLPSQRRKSRMLLDNPILYTHTPS